MRAFSTSVARNARPRCRTVVTTAIVAALLAVPLRASAQFHLPIPPLNGGSLAVRVAGKQLQPYFDAHEPVVRDWSHVYPTVAALPGPPFHPAAARVLRLSGERSVIAQLDSSKTGIVVLGSGDYVVPVRVFCTDIHRHAYAPFVYLLGPLQGTRAAVLARMYARAATVDPDFGSLQSLSWALQAGSKFEQLSSPSQQLFMRLIPRDREAIEEGFLESLRGRWGEISSTIPGVPGFDQALGQMGGLGTAIQQLRDAQNELRNAADFDSLRSELVLGPIGATDNNLLSTPWSVPWAGTYIRLLTAGAFGSLGVLEIRVTAAHGRVPVTDNIGYPPRCPQCQPLTMRPKYNGVPAPALPGVPAVMAAPATGQITFYSDIGNTINNHSALVIRPSTFLLTEDGSVALVHLRWIGWGSSVARATGVWSASNCTPSCATGKLTKRPAKLTLSRPGFVAGHRVYRCFQISPPHPSRDIADRGCIRRDGTSYIYAPGPPLQ